MKKIISILIAILLAFTAFAQSGKELYNKYSDLDGVSAVYISPAMFRMIGKIPDVQMEAANGGNVNLTPIIQSLSGFYLLTAEEPALAEKLFAEVKQLVDRKKCELLFEAKDNGEVTRLYTVGSSNTVSSVFFTSKDAEEFTYMCLEGKMDRDQLENILAEVAAE